MKVTYKWLGTRLAAKPTASMYFAALKKLAEAKAPYLGTVEVVVGVVIGDIVKSSRTDEYYNTSVLLLDRLSTIIPKPYSEILIDAIARYPKENNTDDSGSSTPRRSSSLST